jgi:hypothetical protein
VERLFTQLKGGSSAAFSPLRRNPVCLGGAQCCHGGSRVGARQPDIDAQEFVRLARKGDPASHAGGQSLSGPASEASSALQQRLRPRSRGSSRRRPVRAASNDSSRWPRSFATAAGSASAIDPQASVECASANDDIAAEGSHPQEQGMVAPHPAGRSTWPC